MTSRLLRAVCLLMLGMTACYEPKEGCLDIEAVNFTASADNNCCCEYPELKIEAIQRFNDKVWLPDSTYLNPLGQVFRLRSVAFYLSEFQILQGGTPLGVPDTAQLFVFGPNPGDTLKETFINDFQLVRRATTEYTVGSFRSSGSFDGIRIRMGLPDAAQRVAPNKAPSGHPLRPQAENLWLGRDIGFAPLKMVFTRDTLSATLPDTLTFLPAELGYFIQQDTPLVHQSGEDFRIKLTVDYFELFRNIDLKNDDKATMKSKIVVNLPKVFTVSQ